MLAAATTTHTTTVVQIHNSSNSNRSNNHKGNCDTNLNNNRNNNKIDHTLTGAVSGVGGKAKKNIVEKENHNNHNNIFGRNNNGKVKGANVIPQQRHPHPKHEYYNVIDSEMRAKSPILRRFGDSIDPHQKRRSPSKSDGKYKLSSEHIDRSSDKKESLDSKYTNFSLSKFLNMEIKSPNVVKKPYSNSNSSTNTNSSSLNSFNSFDSVEQAIILGSKGTNVTEGNSYLGPFNFRQLLRPTQGPTESLRKRKGNVNPPSPPPAQKGKNT